MLCVINITTLPLSTGTYSIVCRVYVLTLDMYLYYKVPVISILVAMNVMVITDFLPVFADFSKKIKIDFLCNCNACSVYQN
jgi:hypothetical protein